MPLKLITEAPAAFTPQAIVINAIAQALNSSRGQSGIKVTVSATQIIFDLAPVLNVSITGTAAFANTATTATYANNAATAGYADFAGEATVASVASAANVAYLADVATYANTAGSATSANTAAFADFAGTANFANICNSVASLDANLITGTTLSANVTLSSLTRVGTLSNLEVSGNVVVNYLASNTSIVGANVQMYGSGGKTIDLTDTGLSVNTGTKTATLAFASLTENMSIREIDVCSGNVAMKMLVLASAPY